MTVCWHWWRTGDLYVPHRCQQPQGHPGPHICNCNTTTDKETTVTPHPAKPAGYKPFRDPAQIEADARADERQRIATAIEAEEARLYRQCKCSDEYQTPDHRHGMLRAARIARGDA